MLGVQGVQLLGLGVPEPEVVYQPGKLLALGVLLVDGQPEAVTELREVVAEVQVLRCGVAEEHVGVASSLLGGRCGHLVLLLCIGCRLVVVQPSDRVRHNDRACHDETGRVDRGLDDTLGVAKEHVRVTAARLLCRHHSSDARIDVAVRRRDRQPLRYRVEESLHAHTDV